MTIHKDYARLCAADRRVVDLAFEAAADMFREWGRKASNAAPAEHLVEALATYLLNSGGHALIGEGENRTAMAGDTHPSYGDR